MSAEPRRIYIAGKITSLIREEFLENFSRAEMEIRASGHIPINPSRLHVYDLPYEDYIKIDRILLRSCDEIYMLRNWKGSPGARDELKWAQNVGMKVWYESEKK